MQRFAALAKELEHRDGAPDLRGGQTGVYYNTAVVVDADGTILGKYRKHHIPHLDRFWEKFYFRPGNLGYPVFDTAVGKIGVYICYDRHFPEGWRELGLNGAHMVFNPNATKPGLSATGCGRSRARAPRSPTATSCSSPTGSAARTTSTATRPSTSTAPARSSTRAATSSASAARRTEEELLIRDLDLDMVRQMRDDWQFYRDRRPDSYTAIAPSR